MQSSSIQKLREITSFHALLTKAELPTKEIWAAQLTDYYSDFRIHVIRNESWEPYLSVIERVGTLFNRKIFFSYSSLGFFPTVESIPDSDLLLIWLNSATWNEEGFQNFYGSLFEKFKSLSARRIVVITMNSKDRDLAKTMLSQASLQEKVNVLCIDSANHLGSYFQSNLISLQSHSRFLIQKCVSDLFYLELLPAIVDIPRLIFLDLDNTLLNGIISEMDSEDDEERFRPKQNNFISELRKRGILLVLLTKNLESDVKLFLKNEVRLGLSYEDFLFIKAGWEKKSDMAYDVLTESNLHASQCLFIDDNIKELLDMKAALPDIKCLRATEEEEVLVALKRLFNEPKNSESKQDSNRREREKDIQAASKRKLLRQGQMVPNDDLSLHQILKTFILAAPLREDSLDRVNDLLRKTNQFNISLKRTVLSSSEIQENRVYTCVVSDSFAESGIISAIVISNKNHISEFVISCRVLGRGLEPYILRSMLDLDAPINPDGVYLVTPFVGPRNEPAREFFSQFSNGLISNGNQQFVRDKLGKDKLYNYLCRNKESND